jgi:hypothetical protein
MQEEPPMKIYYSTDLGVIIKSYVVTDVSLLKK